MAYIRKQGRQIALVHGQRNSGSGNVEQRVLFTIYSQAEAEEILGCGRGLFQSLLEDRYPELKFDWKRVVRDLRALLHVLPAVHRSEAADRRAGFRRDLLAFTRQILLANPQDSSMAAEIVRGNRRELEFVREAIDWHLKLSQQAKTRPKADDAFHWRFRVQGNEVPIGAEEHAMGLYERGETDAAEAAFRLLVEAFDGYADGYNMLGVIALDRDEAEKAIPLFQKTVDIGRRLFPKRLKKSSYWSRLETRPYIRGLRNLALALLSKGQHEEALAICDRLVQECGDDVTADSHRASIYLNQGRWAEAAETARRLINLHESEDFVAAFAYSELGRWGEALSAFLHAALNHPRAARMLVGLRSTRVKEHREAEDHNVGVELSRSLGGYFERQSRRSRRFFLRVMKDERVEHLLAGADGAVRRWSEEKGEKIKTLYERMELVKSLEFAQRQAENLADLLPDMDD